MNCKSIKWTEELVQEWVENAARVDRVLPPVYNKHISGQCWDIRREWYELLWDTEQEQPEPRFQPTNQQISMWEEVMLRWFPLIEDNQNKKILWLRACSRPWTKIAKKVHLTRQTVAKRHQATIEDLTRKVCIYYTKIS